MKWLIQFTFVQLGNDGLYKMYSSLDSTQCLRAKGEIYLPSNVFNLPFFGLFL